MAVTPTLHTFDPLLPGKVGLYIDAAPSADMIIWIASKSATTGFAQVGVTNVNTTVGLDGLSFIVDGGPPGSVTYWEAKLHDSAGYGAPSAAVAATSSAGPPAPPAPTVPGAPTSVGAIAGDTTATVYWTPPASNGGSVLTGYTVTPYKAGVALSAIQLDASKASTQVIGLTDGQSYTFTVIATNAVGSSAESVASAAVTPTAPPPPLTQEQQVNQALSISLQAGDIIDVYPATPTTTKTVQADGSIR